MGEEVKAVVPIKVRCQQGVDLSLPVCTVGRVNVLKCACANANDECKSGDWCNRISDRELKCEDTEREYVPSVDLSIVGEPQVRLSSSDEGFVQGGGAKPVSDGKVILGIDQYSDVKIEFKLNGVMPNTGLLVTVEGVNYDEFVPTNDMYSIKGIIKLSKDLPNKVIISHNGKTLKEFIIEYK